MKIGYARVSTSAQNLDMQVTALTDAGCEKIYSEKVSGVAHRGPGYYCDRINDPDMWSQVARSLAMDNIQLQTRAFKKAMI